MTKLEAMIKELPQELHKEVEDFVESLIKKNNANNGNAERKYSFKWAGALKDLRDQYTSVELQHAISKLRIDEK